MQLLVSLLSGLTFGLGLILSGMTDPAKIIGFLNLAGAWDPSLAFVMAGAVAVVSVAFRIAGRRTTSFMGDPLHIPATKIVDFPLVAGALLFGMGWGLAGYCPGPALASLAAGGSKPVVFALAMLAGMAVFEAHARYLRHAQSRPA